MKKGDIFKIFIVIEICLGIITLILIGYFIGVENIKGKDFLSYEMGAITERKHYDEMGYFTTHSFRKIAFEMECPPKTRKEFLEIERSAIRKYMNSSRNIFKDNFFKDADPNTSIEFENSYYGCNLIDTNDFLKKWEWIESNIYTNPNTLRRFIAVVWVPRKRNFKINIFIIDDPNSENLMIYFDTNTPGRHKLIFTGGVMIGFPILSDSDMDYNVTNSLDVYREHNINAKDKLYW